MTLTRRQVVDLLTTHGLKPSRALGQNFVVDPNTVRRIVRLAEIGPGDRVVEVGAGLGSLTGELAATGASVVAVEADRHLMPVLEAVVVDPNVRLVQGDAMTVDWASLLGDEPGWILVANLPYNIATPLVADVLDQVPQIERMLVMVQKEVGERLVASAGDSGYGAVSVKVRYWADAEMAGDVPATVFHPKPKVDSVLVAIRRRPAPALDPAIVDRGRLFDLVRTGFATRRKMLRRALSGRVTPEAFVAAGVNPQSRAEELELEAWGRLVVACAGSEEASSSGESEVPSAESQSAGGSEPVGSSPAGAGAASEADSPSQGASAMVGEEPASEEQSASEGESSSAEESSGGGPETAVDG